MKKTALLVALLLATTALGRRRPQWFELKGYTFEQYVKDHDKHYDNPVEYARRAALFSAKLAEVIAFNEQVGPTYKKGMNHMSDLTPEERKHMNGGRHREMAHLLDATLQRPFRASNTPLPYAVDYRNSVPAVLTTVKDQGMCGSCWAHGSTEQLETYWAMSSNDLFVMSQQQVTACAPNPNQCGGTGGCFGSTAELAFEYVINAGGITQEWEYPYTAYNGTTGVCLANGHRKVAKFTGYTTLPANDQALVMDALAHTGPLAVNVDASQWNDYESGIYSGCNYANNISIDHVVQLVGYGTDAGLGLDYWIIRNSWSASYGEHGFIRLLRQATPACGWDVDAQDGYACANGPKQLWVCGECGVLGDTSFPIPLVN